MTMFCQLTDFHTENSNYNLEVKNEGNDCFTYGKGI